ncbi:hypothetical protein GCM10009560_38300 [Nonomuraea longicatena]|uniref:Uncharacterized protein n=2 Tax=Nonomuraea longicatena TaxID=83682 RepID=A0ABN1PU09_9ACTN
MPPILSVPTAMISPMSPLEQILTAPRPSRPARLFDAHADWDARQVAEVFGALSGWEFRWRDESWLGPLVEHAHGFTGEDREAVWRAARPLVEAIEGTGFDAVECRRLQRRLAELRPAGPGLPVEADEWGKAVRRALGPTPPPHLTALVEQLCGLSGPRPQQRWRTGVLRLCEREDARALVAAALAAFAHDTSHAFRPGSFVVCEANVDVAKGFAWAAALLGLPGVVPALASVAARTSGQARGRWQQERLCGGVINALGALDDPAAIDALTVMRREIRALALLKQVAAALAGRQGHTPPPAGPRHG